MEKQIFLKDDFIRLGQVMKAAHVCMSGGEAKELIAGGAVKVNGETETRRGRKLREGDLVLYGDNLIRIESREGGQSGHDGNE